MAEQKNLVLIATHSVFINGKPVHGPAHILADFLIRQNVPHRLIELPLASNLLDWPKQMLQINKLAKELQPTVFIGIDPLNGWVGRSLKRKGIIKRFVYHTPDYSPKRFNFGPLNALYHWIDRQALLVADDVWTVSNRITEVRKQQGRTDARTIFNGIPFDQDRIPKFLANRRFRLVLVGNLNDSMDLPMIVRVVGKLAKKFPKLRLDFVGDGKQRQSLKDQVSIEKLGKTVTFHGSVPLDQVISLLQKSGVGLALYSGKAGFNAFGDSKKIREYSAVGLPVITTPIVANAQEIRRYNAGVVTPATEAGLSKAITRLVSNPNKYRQQRNSAIRLAKDTDLEKILVEAFKSIGVVL